MKRKNLKRGIYTSPQSGTQEFERYVIENEQDLNAFLNSFPTRMTMMSETLKKSLAQGYTIIATDEDPMSRMPTYCFESKEDDQHPSSFHRVRLVENI